MYHRRKAQGLCPVCGGERQDKNFVYCDACREKQNKRKDNREYMRRWWNTAQGQELRLKGLSERRLQPVDPERPESYVECAICGEKFRQITSGHLKLHDMTAAEYRELGQPFLCQEKLERNREVIRARARELSGENHPGWKGGHKSKASGYRIVCINGKRELEHRVIMAEVLGRPLRSDEQVHHIDGNRANNDPSNLVIVDASEHTKITAKRHHTSWRRLGVVTIRLLLENGWDLYRISSEFNVSIGTLIKRLQKHPDELTDYTD
jgi:hypothetical protein